MIYFTRSNCSSEEIHNEIIIGKNSSEFTLNNNQEILPGKFDESLL